MDSKNKYLDFYKENFGQGKYCSKSWGLASYEAGQQSKQAEIDKIKQLLKQWDDWISVSANHNCIEIVKECADELRGLLK